MIYLINKYCFKELSKGLRKGLRKAVNSITTFLTELKYVALPLAQLYL